MLGLIEDVQKSDLVGVYELNKRWHFLGLVSISLFLNQVKSLSDVDSNSDITVSA